MTLRRTVSTSMAELRTVSTTQTRTIHAGATADQNKRRRIVLDSRIEDGFARPKISGFGDSWARRFLGSKISGLDGQVSRPCLVNRFLPSSATAAWFSYHGV